MKKIKYILLFFIVLSLSGCRTILSIMDMSNLELEVEDNLRVSIYDYETFDWSKVVKLKTSSKEIDSKELTIKPQERVDSGQIAQIKVSYKKIFTSFEDEFFVEITDGSYKISELKNVDHETTVKLRGTVLEVNESGLILSDSTGTIYINKEDVNKKINERSTVNVIGTFFNGVFTDVAITLNDDELELYSSENIASNNFSSHFENNFETTYITTEGVVKHENNDLYVLLDDGSKIIINKNNSYEYSSMIMYDGQRICITGWVINCNKEEKTFEYIHDFVNYEFYYEKVGNSPIITADASYFYFSSQTAGISIADLTQYFSIYDVEDGNIEVSSTMFEGNISYGQNIITISVTDSDLNTSSYSFVVEMENKKDIINEDISTTNPYAMPTEGKVNVLVIPVAFPDYERNQTMLDDIEKGFFGTKSNTGWESLQSYYKKSSYGKLQIDGLVTDWYVPHNDVSYYANYEDEDDYYNGATILMIEALTYFQHFYDLSKFDSNDDGYLDAVYMIYNVGVGGNGSSSQESFYWAFTSWDYNADQRNYADTVGFGYVFMGYDFFKQRTSYSNTVIAVNSETVIHETGHLFNLVDYYDYDEEDNVNGGGYGGCDMMDHNIGDHGPYSKILLNWVEPTVVTRSGIYRLQSFTSTGQTLLIPANGTFWSIYDEYYLIDFYTFSGLNALEMKSFFKTNRGYAGIRVSHINSSLKYSSDYLPYFKYDNTSSSNKLITILEADYDGDFDINSSYGTIAELTDFYQVGQTFGIGAYENYKSHKGNELPFTMKVLKINNDYAFVEIIFK